MKGNMTDVERQMSEVFANYDLMTSKTKKDSKPRE